MKLAPYCPYCYVLTTVQNSHRKYECLLSHVLGTNTSCFVALGQFAGSEEDMESSKLSCRTFVLDPHYEDAYIQNKLT
ncbi:hypothetical protein OESDEN_10737 [Oesophagostomum dentatum]|uniref:Uncharacterized protein n=1 Tax=Oesophagostomum dentatum TaxID=61180 RepID=A0A0B1T0Z0_OESDE|nr:hypothetical protein OESDEN_10737 [Oesophagostomum dentatum]